MYQKLNACPLCGNSQFKNYMVVKDHAVSGESFALSKCLNCRLVFTNPRPDDQNLHRYYQHPEYISHVNRPQNLQQWIYQTVRYFTLRQKINWINQLNPKKSHLLDFGCGTGAFLKVAQRSGWNCQGVEPDEKALQSAINQNLTVKADLADLSQKQYGVITLWHVLEHLPDLTQTVKQLLSTLPKSGQLWVAVPNRDSFDCRYYQEYWAGYDIPRHLYHFNQENTRFLASKFKLKIIKIIPLKLDAYYVSILSEKYRHASIMNGIKQGYLSNKWASTHDLDYSSLVYVFQK